MNTTRRALLLSAFSLLSCNYLFFDPPEQSATLNASTAMAAVVDAQAATSLGGSPTGTVLYTVSGTLAGSASSTDLILNGSETINAGIPGSFVFQTKLEDGASYSVALGSGVSCTIDLPSGTVNKANVVLTITACINT